MKKINPSTRRANRMAQARSMFVVGLDKPFCIIMPLPSVLLTLSTSSNYSPLRDSKASDIGSADYGYAHCGHRSWCTPAGRYLSDVEAACLLQEGTKQRAGNFIGSPLLQSELFRT